MLTIFCLQQYGFREGFSTEHAIVDIVSAIQCNMYKRLITCGIFIDLKKAFDIVNHQIFLNKLNRYGFCGIINNWFESFLCNRSQTLEINKQLSDVALISNRRHHLCMNITQDHPLKIICTSKNLILKN